MAKTATILLAFLLSLRLPAAAEEQASEASFCEGSAACVQHFSAAQQAGASGQVPQAIAEYQQTYALKPFPLLLFHIARLHHTSGNSVEALRYYRKYLDAPEAGEDAPREQARGAIVELAGALVSAAPPAAIAPAAPAPPLVAVSRPVYKRWWFWSLLGVAVAGAATGVAFGVYAQQPDVSGLPGTRLILNPEFMPVSRRR
jgi:hypothetical protein